MPPEALRSRLLEPAGTRSFPDVTPRPTKPQSIRCCSSFEEDNLRSVGRRKISRLNRKAIPPTIVATPIVSMSKAQKNIVAAVSKIAKVEFEICRPFILAGFFVSDVAAGYDLQPFRAVAGRSVLEPASRG
jgi:hypothetical protein